MLDFYPALVCICRSGFEMSKIEGWVCKYLLWAFLSIYYPVHRKASEMIEMYFFQAKPVSPIALHGLRHRAHPTG